jgi:hypothetical protein
MKSLSRIAAVVFGLLLLSAGLATAQDLSVGNYVLISKKRVSRVEYEYTYSADIINNGPLTPNVTATLTSTSAHTSVVDGSLTFGDVPAGATVTSSDTFVIKQNRLYPFDPSALLWDVGYGPDLAQIHALIQRFAPILYFSTKEEYWLDDPEYVLDNGASFGYGVECTLPSSVCVGIVGFKLYEKERFSTSAATIVDDTYAALNDWYDFAAPVSPYWLEGRYWLHIPDELETGDLERAKALVRVLPINNYPEYIEIQFWLFYPFNGPGRVRLCAFGLCDDIWLNEPGQHHGDWERVSILVNYVTEELHAVDISIHGDSATFDCALGRSSGLQGECPCLNGVGRMECKGIPGIIGPRNLHLDPDEGTHPEIYVAAWSHALYQYASDHIHYENDRLFDLGAIAYGNLFDRTDAHLRFEICPSTGSPRYRILSSEVPNAPVAEPDWVSWGTEYRSGYYSCVECPPWHDILCIWMDFFGNKPRCGQNIMIGGRWGQAEYQLCHTFVDIGIYEYEYCMDGSGPSGPVKQPEWDGVTWWPLSSP